MQLKSEDYFGVNILHSKSYAGFYEAYVCGAGFLKADTIKGLKKLIDENRKVVATIQDWPMITLIYEVDDDFIICKHGGVFTNLYGSADKAPIKRYKIYHAQKRGYYFKINNRRFYLDTATISNW